jgi:hypothetical protein
LTARIKKGSRISKKNPQKNHDKNKISKRLPPSSTDIFSSRKHNMDYVTVDGVIRRTGYSDKSDWYLLCVKELMDNAIDFEWKYYAGTNDAAVNVDITIDDSFFYLKVRNTNRKNIPVFQNLSAIFDYEMTYGSKQNQHIISRGLLGDAAKQIGTWPYVLIHTKDDGSAFTDKQWDMPLIIRANRVEQHVFTKVDKASQIITAEVKPVHGKPLPHTDTEIEITWPVVDDIRLDIHKIERFCRQYIIFTTDISFNFQIVDNRTVNEDDYDSEIIVGNDFAPEPANASKEAITIEAPALHPISAKWNNISSVHSYNPEEFVSAITSVYDKEGTSVYDVLRTYKEGTQMQKTPDTQISVTELMEDHDKDKKLESFYHMLKQILKPSKRLSLPYSHIKPEERKRALVERIAQLYPKDHLNTGKAVYRLINDSYNDDKIRKIWNEDTQGYTYQQDAGILHYPFVFEIIAIPLSDDVLKEDTNRPTELIGGVNYSIAPKSNIFEGSYQWTDKKSGYQKSAYDINDILQKCGFEFYSYSGPKVKLPCIIAANLVSPRIDYHERAKTRIDTQPFSSAIIAGALKISEEIRTFRASGYEFYTEREMREFSKTRREKMTVQAIVEEVLRERKRAAGL